MDFGKRMFGIEHDFIALCELTHVDSGSLMMRRWVSLLPIVFVWVHWIFVPIGIVLYKLPYWKMKQERKVFIDQLNVEFAIWLRIMEVYLAYHTVHGALRHSLLKAPVFLRSSLEELCQKLEEDPTEKAHYLSFMEAYQKYNIQQTMYHLFRYATLGNDDASRQLTTLIQDNAQQLKLMREDIMQQRLAFYSWISLIPMLALSLTFLGLMMVLLPQLVKGGWGI